MEFVIREIDKKNSQELDIVTRRCMATILETIPEFHGQESIAQAHLKNFSYSQMASMIQNDLDDPTKRIMVVVSDNQLVGQALYSIKHDDEGVLYGFCFSRYVVPKYRRMGIAAALLDDAINWFTLKGASYILAQTHIANIPLQTLFNRFGFQMTGPHSSTWQYYTLRKDLQ